LTLSYRWDSISVRAIAMTDYYANKLTADRLRRCYEIAPPRVQQYLEAEIDHVLTRIHPDDIVLELGCGYGRILAKMAGKAGRLVGIDTSRASLSAGRAFLASRPHCHLIQADAIRLPFPDRSFDAVLCLQNGLSAFHVDPERLIRESLRVMKPGGFALFSSYSERFWPHRLAWFELQSAEGLVGEIDEEKTGDGRIVCRDGFTATTFRPEDFRKLADSLEVTAEICEVDDAIVFCEVRKPSRHASLINVLSRLHNPSRK